MQTIRDLMQVNQLKFFALVIILGCSLLLSLSACGKKGPLYREDAKEQPQQK
jgi:predicted small lipoprotein YifL